MKWALHEKIDPKFLLSPNNYNHDYDYGNYHNYDHENNYEIEHKIIPLLIRNAHSRKAYEI